MQLLDPVDQADQSALKRLSLVQLKCARGAGREKRISATSDDRVKQQSQFIHETGLDETCRYAASAHEVEVFSALLLQDREIIDSVQKMRLRPVRRL